MDLHIIDPYQFSVQPHDLFDRQMALLTSGDFAKGEYNCMTIGWGCWHNVERSRSIGCGTPKSLHLQFMEQFDNFTVTAFPKKI